MLIARRSLSALLCTITGSERRCNTRAREPLKVSTAHNASPAAGCHAVAKTMAINGPNKKMISSSTVSNAYAVRSASSVTMEAQRVRINPSTGTDEQPVAMAAAIIAHKCIFSSTKPINERIAMTWQQQVIISTFR
ncbi:hypothetical protein D3C72_1951260 [compost metagenome]